MKYYIKETQIDVERQKTAGVKARNDLESIFEDVGIKRLDMPVLMEKNDTSSKLARTDRESDIVIHDGTIYRMPFMTYLNPP